MRRRHGRVVTSKLVVSSTPADTPIGDVIHATSLRGRGGGQDGNDWVDTDYGDESPWPSKTRGGVAYFAGGNDMEGMYIQLRDGFVEAVAQAEASIHTLARMSDSHSDWSPELAHTRGESVSLRRPALWWSR